jgi:tetratricopeptide (TPR) repeat protein
MHAGGQAKQYVAGRDMTITDSASSQWQVTQTLVRDVVTLTGRDSELEQLAASAAGAAEAVVIRTVHGMPGVGKTALVKHAAHQLEKDFPDGRLWVDLHGHTPGQQPTDPSTVLADLLTSTGMPADDIPARMEARAARWRDHLAGKKVLLVLDDAAGPSQVEPLLPGTAGCLVLITSRRAMTTLDGAWQLPLPILPPGKAMELFRRLAERPQDDTSAIAKLAELCGYLPLAITVLAGRLAQPSWDIAAFTAEFSATRDRLSELATEGQSVAAAFEMSYRYLSEDQQRLFRLLGLHPGTDIYTSAAAALTGAPPGQCRRELEALSNVHLIDSLGRDRYRFHDLIREYARTLTGRDALQAIERLLDYYLDRADKADKHLRALPGMPVPEDFESQDRAFAWLDAERPSLIAAVSLAESTGLYYTAMQLPLKLDVYLRGRRHFEELRSIAKIGLDAARHQKNRHCEGLALANLGAALWELRRFEEAITACHEAVTIFQDTGEKHDEGLARTNLGIALWKLRRFDEAVTECQAAVTIFREMGEKHGEGLALVNLAAALVEERRFEEAITACRAAVAIFKKIGESHGEGVALDNLAAALAGQRRFEEAITACRDAGAIYRDPRDQHGEGHVLANLGAALTEECQFEEAITACQEADAIFKQTGDRHHEGVARTNLGAALRRQGRFEEAITACQDAAAIFKDIGDSHHEGVARTNLGAVLAGQCRFEEAITACQDAAAIFKQTGDPHGESQALENLAAAQAGQREFKEAVITSQDATISQETADQHDEYWESLMYLTRPRWTRTPIDH